MKQDKTDFKSFQIDVIYQHHLIKQELRNFVATSSLLTLLIDDYYLDENQF